MAGVASALCSYNLVNGKWACENNSTLNGILKGEFGFQGFIMSDWHATHATIDAIAGLDMTMPGDISYYSGTSYFGANLTAYVQQGIIPEARVDDMATRILAAWYLLGQDSPNYPKPNFNANDPQDEATNEHIDVQDDHDVVVRQIGAASAVLLKNVNGALPLKKPRTLMLIGSDAGPAQIGPNKFPYQIGVDGILGVGWGSGYVGACGNREYRDSQIAQDCMVHVPGLGAYLTAACFFLCNKSQLIATRQIAVRGDPGSRTPGSHYFLLVF